MFGVDPTDINEWKISGLVCVIIGSMLKIINTLFNENIEYPYIDVFKS